MVKSQYPLPLISDVIDKLKNARIFTKFDVQWGYNNVQIKPGNEWKAAFKMNCGMFKPLVMFFGLTNSPAMFQAMMNEIFKDLIGTGKVFIYMDLGGNGHCKHGKTVPFSHIWQLQHFP